VTLFLSREDFAALLSDHPALVHGLYVSAVRRDGETAQALESSAFTTIDYQLDEIAPDETVAKEPFVAEETRLYGDVYVEPTPPAIAQEPEAQVTAPAPEPTKAAQVTAPAPEPTKAAQVTAPFPPVLRAPPPVEEHPASLVATSVSVPPALPSVPATAQPSAVATPDLGPPPPVLSSASPVIGEPQRPGTLPRFSSMSALVASKPPKASGPGPSASRVNRFGELPPVAVLGMFAGVAVLGFALAAPFSNHLNTAAASGGSAQDDVAPSDVPAAASAARDPNASPAPEKPAVAAPTPTPPPAPAPAKSAEPAPRHRATTAHAKATTSPAPIATEEASVAPAPSASAANTVAPSTTLPPGPKTATAAAPVADEFGGRE
jgi:hypothetical protein